MTANSLRDGIVLWGLLERKCQQRVCQHTDVVETGQVGWMILILQWKMVKLKGWSALVIVLPIANMHYYQYTRQIEKPASSKHTLSGPQKTDSGLLMHYQPYS